MGSMIADTVQVCEMRLRQSERQRILCGGKRRQRQREKERKNERKRQQQRAGRAGGEQGESRGRGKEAATGTTGKDKDEEQNGIEKELKMDGRNSI